MDNLRINAERLWDSLMELAQIGATEKGGVCRLALTDVDKTGRDLFVQWCEDAGCKVSVDRVGNIFARRSGQNNNLPPIMTGSHLDSQPTGGKFDGAYGVLAGLEVIRALNDAGLETNAPVEVVAWTNEEGSRFSPPMMGSGAFAQVFEESYVLERPDNVTGETVGEELKRIGYDGPQPVGGRDVGAYFEAHIEQGPILEDEQKTVGVVTGAQGQRWYEVIVTGQEAHAGPTPMILRKDALVASARMIDAVNRVGHDHLPGACATCGFVEVKPNSRNTIPGEVFFTVDLRHPSDDTLAKMDQAFRERCQAIAIDSGVELRIEDFWHFPATPFDDGCVAAVRDGASRGGYASMDIVSGAGHDAVYMSRVAPTGMIFIPCEGGISHNEIENATREDCAAGAQVLLSAIVARANG